MNCVLALNMRPCIVTNVCTKCVCNYKIKQLIYMLRNNDNDKWWCMHHNVTSSVTLAKNEWVVIGFVCGSVLYKSMVDLSAMMM